MEYLAGSQTIIVDVETQFSAQDCRHCGLENVEPLHSAGQCQGVAYAGNRFEPLGWDNKAALGLSIGCSWDSADQRCHVFDVHTLEETMRSWVVRQPILVSFNGLAFDFPLMRGLLRREADRLVAEDGAEMLAQDLRDLCDTFKTLCATSYDILAEIWKVDPTRKFASSLNSLDAISQANGLGAKLSNGAQAPRDWQAGRVAQVIEYCLDDVWKTKALFERICAGDAILRGDGQPIRLRRPVVQEGADAHAV